MLVNITYRIRACVKLAPLRPLSNALVALGVNLCDDLCVVVPTIILVD
jgi:hypothetical protein